MITTTYRCERCDAALTEAMACWFMAECVCPQCFLATFTEPDNDYNYDPTGPIPFPKHRRTDNA